MIIIIKEYKSLDVKKSKTEKTMNDMTKNGWKVVNVTFWHDLKAS